MSNLLLYVSVPVVGGYLSSLASDFTATETWYKKIKKPSVTPPKFAFPVVWTYLYASSGYALFRVVNSPLFIGSASAGQLVTLNSLITAQASSAPYWFAIQLGLNYLWSPLFFGQRKIGSALVDISLLWLSLIPTAVSFWRNDPLAGKLILPYIAWVSLASYLNGYIYFANKGVKFAKKHNQKLNRFEWHVVE